MTINATWTSPVASGTLDLDTDEVISETWVDAVASNFNFIGGVSGVYGCHAYHDATQSITDDTLTVLALNQERLDTDTMHDLVTNNSRITFTTAGKYVVGANVSFAADADGYRQLAVLLNGTSIGRVIHMAAPATTNCEINVVVYYAMTAAQYSEAQVRHTAGAAINVQTSPTPALWALKVG